MCRSLGASSADRQASKDCHTPVSKQAINDSLSNVINKSKRAANSLALLLHAKSCRSGPHKCQVRGCTETKLLLLHMKTCNVKPGAVCSRSGCRSARKLLAHYRECKESRIRSTSDRPHRCLLCSLVARQVKEELNKASLLKAKLSATAKKTHEMLPPPIHRICVENSHTRRRSIPAGFNFCSQAVSLSTIPEQDRTFSSNFGDDTPSTPKMSNIRYRSKSEGDAVGRMVDKKSMLVCSI